MTGKGKFRIRLFVLSLVIALAFGCDAPEEVYTVELVPLNGQTNISRQDNPRQIVGMLVLGLTGQQSEIEELGNNRFRFTIEASITPGAIARFQTPSVELTLAGWTESVADNRPVPEEAEVIVTEKDIKNIWMEDDRFGKPVLIFEFTEQGQSKFETYTAQHIGEFVIFGIDGRVVNWIPIREPVLGERGMIEGRFSKEQAIRYLWGIRMSMTGYRLQIVDETGKE